ncbi:MAG: bifunctional riboflavin kinase/FAD synthetase [Ruminococcus sp.]|nr:bifunctional riboflavin kinase/FAD synthetase [Ruminococcus sp.]
MQVFRDLTPSDKATAVALGYFDGVHLGHRAVLSRAAECKKHGLVPAAFTFSSTPKPKDKNSLLSTYSEKIKILEELGIEILYILDFENLKNKSPEEFVTKIIRDIFKAKEVFCGFNYKFGKLGSGNTDTLKKLCKRENISVGICEPVKKNGIIVSSTEIRNRLKNGEIKVANNLLGYRFGITGKSIEGNHIGTSMDTPTINLKFEDGIVLPKFGVYASIVTLDKKEYIGVTNIGVKPTVSDKNSPICETWMPQFKGGNLYGETVDVRLVEFIRPEKKFNSLENLKTAIKSDGQKAIDLLKN